MSNQEFKTEDFSLFLDGRMSPEDQDRLRRRFQEEPELYSTFLQFKTATEMVRAARGMKQLPSTFDQKLRERIQVDQIRQRAQRRVHEEEGRYTITQKLTLAATGLAAGVALMLGLLPFFNSTSTETIVVESPSTLGPLSVYPSGTQGDPRRLVEASEENINALRRSIIRLQTQEIPGVVLQSELKVFGLDATSFERSVLFAPSSEELSQRIEIVRRVLSQLEQMARNPAIGVDRDVVLEALKGEKVAPIYLQNAKSQEVCSEDVIAFKALRRMNAESPAPETAMYALSFLKQFPTSELFPFVVRNAVDALLASERPDVAFGLLRTLLDFGPAGLSEVSLSQIERLDSMLAVLPAPEASATEVPLRTQRTIKPDAPGSVVDLVAGLMQDLSKSEASGIDAFERKEVIRRLRR